MRARSIVANCTANRDDGDLSFSTYSMLFSGLDPAFPLYNLMGRQGRLSSGDALFVDVIHTNAGIFGYPTPIGDVDFYPNPESPIQPGCLPQDLVRRRILNRIGV